MKKKVNSGVFRIICLKRNFRASDNSAMMIVQSHAWEPADCVRYR